MSEYIERGALIEFAKHQWCESCREAGEDYNGIVCRACVVAYVCEQIEDTPTADVVEVKHGEWEKVSWWQHQNRYECNECSLCGCRVKPKFTYNFCPKCGAKMDGGADK